MARKPDGPLLNTADVAKVLRVHPKHVYRLLRRGMPARRLGGEWRYVLDDVLAWTSARGGAASAEPAPAPSVPAEPRDAERTAPLLAANGDVVIEALLARVNAGGPPLLGFVVADRAESLALLERRAVVAAGSHGAVPPTRLGAARLARIHLVEREVGLVYASGAAPKLSRLPRLRVASRPPTAGILMHLRHALERAGVDVRAAFTRATAHPTHRDVVCAVRRGEADVGVATRAWAERVGLGFARLATESYGLLVRGVDLGDALVVRVCEAAQSSAFRSAMRGVGGYDPRGAGDIRYDPELHA
jgi:molybdate-binding protein